MYYMVVFVVNNPDECTDVMDAWEEAGCSGITILESSGLGRLRGYGVRDDVPLMPGIQDLLRSQEVRHRTLFTVVEGEGMVDAVLAATEAVVGSLDQANTGFLFAVPVSRVHGMRKPPIPGA